MVRITIKQKLGIMNTLEHGKRSFLYLILVIVLFSCNVKEKKQIEMPFYQLKNKILIKEILNYIDSNDVSASNKEVMSVCVYQYQDTLMYDLSTEISAYGLISTPATVYLDVEGNTVAFSFFGIQDVIMPDSIAWQYLKNIFPEEYAYYQEYNDYPPPPTQGEIIWRLIFKEQKLINKKIIIHKN